MSSRFDGGWILPNELQPPDTLCVQFRIPNTLEYRLATIGAIYELQYWFNWQRTGDPSGSVAAQEFRRLLNATLRIDEQCVPVGADFGGNGGSGGTGGDGGTFDDLISLMMEMDMKFTLPDGTLYEAAIPLVPCGCGDGSGGGDGTSGAGGVTGPVPGSTPGGAYGGSVPSLCDLISGNFANYIAQRVDDMVGEIQTGVFVVDNVISIFDIPVADSWVSQVRDNADSIAGQLSDPTFLNTLNDIFVRQFNDPVSPALTRNDLLALASRVPLIQEGAPMQVAFLLWAAIANVSAINGALPSYVGRCDTAIAQPFFDARGRPLYSSSGDSGNITGDLCRLFDFAVDDQNWRVIPPTSDISYASTRYAPSQGAWARPGNDPAGTQLGIEVQATGLALSVEVVTVACSATDAQSAAGVDLILFNGDSNSYERRILLPELDGSINNISFNVGGRSADRMQIVMSSLRGNSVYTVNSVDVGCN